MRSLDLVAGTGLARRRLMTAGVFAISVLAWLVEPLLGLERWVGWLPTTVGVSEIAVAFVPSVICGFAAWVAGQPRLHGMNEWSETSPRSAAGRIAPSLLVVAGAAIAAQVVAMLVLGGVSVRHGVLRNVTGVDLLLSVPTMTAYLLVWTAVGAALGRSVRLLTALPVAVVGPYLLYYLSVASLSDSPIAALLIGNGSVYDYVRPTTLMVVTRASFWVVLVAVTWSRLLGRARLSIAAGWIASIVAALALLQGATLVPVAGATDPVCRGTAPIACLDRSHLNTMGPYRKAIDRLWDSVPDPLRPSAIGSSPELLPAGTDGLVVPPVAGLETVARVVDDSMFAARFGDALFYRTCTEASPGIDTAAALTFWWRSSMGIPLDRPAYIGDGRYRGLTSASGEQDRAATSFAQVPEAERNRWFQANRERLFRCAALDLPAP